MGLRTKLVAVMIGLAAWQGGAGAWIYVKAALAQVLLANAWEQTLDGGEHVKPWSWADTSPVARLTVDRLAVDRIVLVGASGEALAFGPGLVEGSPEPGDAGNSVIVGHRDTQFGFLRELREGDRIRVQRRSGRQVVFVVATASIVDSRQVALVLDTAGSVLTLVACYPFDASAPGGPLRYVVTAYREDLEEGTTGGSLLAAAGSPSIQPAGAAPAPRIPAMANPR